MLKQSLKVAGTFMATALALAVTAPNAKAINFTFSFDNVTGSTAGTVSGLITGLEDNTANQAADNVFITDVPAALGGTFEGNDAVAWTGNVSDFENLFSVTNGEIVAASFSARGSDGLSSICIQEGSRCNGVQQLLEPFNGNGFIRNSGGIGSAATGVEFSPAASTPVPFGVVPDTGIGILAGMWGISRLRKTMRGRKSLNK